MYKSILDTANAQIKVVELVTDYKGQGYKKNFNEHIDTLFTVAIGDTNMSILDKKDLQISKKLYWELESHVLEKYEDDVSDDFLDDLDEIEGRLRESIVIGLGSFYENIPEMNDLIDYSTNGVIMSNRFSLTSAHKNIANPWDHSKAILIDNGLLHSFYKDKSYLKGLGIKDKSNDSVEIDGHKLTIVGKGRKHTFSSGTIRDIFGLRGHVYNLIKEHANDSDRPIKSETLIGILRGQGIKSEELSDGQIKAWLINPLKKIGKIGSCVEGYFNLSSCKDLQVTYNSHFENFKGYLNSLENYRRISEYSSCHTNVDISNPFEAHIQKMRDMINSFDS